MRSDPTDNGGLFVGRRPGTAPVRYRAVPERGGARRRALDGLFAGSILALMGLVAATFWGPIPTAWLWVAAQTQYHTKSLALAIFVAFAGMMATLLAGLAAMRRLDQFWVLVRRAAGYDQRHGVIGIVFAVAAVVGGSAFAFWLLIIAGPGATLAPK